MSKVMTASFITEYDLYLLREGRHYKSYEKLGAHLVEHEDMVGVHFAVWAPNARHVSVVGDFNGWNDTAHPMTPLSDSGLWVLFIENLTEGTLYKYAVVDAYGHRLPLKADPYGFSAEGAPGNASRVWTLPKSSYVPVENQHCHKPMAIYEVHLGSWRRDVTNHYLDYRTLADELVPYAKWMGFTHIECMPVFEHPFDGSWGYQPVGLYAPTSRFGTPDDFLYFVDAIHDAGLKCILDWVPGHFPNDPHGLSDFDGTKLYEHLDPRLGKHKDWDTLIYNYGRNEVVNFLISNALFWIERYGIDGLRVDAVASMIYRNYSRGDGEWEPNIYGTVENLEATAFLRRLNEIIGNAFPYVTVIAEESSAWPMVSRPTDTGGLGFGYKWNMGWMHDTLAFMGKDPIHRKHHHHMLTFGLVYAFTENFVLPLSHDEVVHGKGSLLQKMSGSGWEKFASLRSYYAFMYGYPGKKLLFMGNEFAQLSEWNHDKDLDWHLLEYPLHQGMQSLIRDLNHLYVTRKCLHHYDCAQQGFEWLLSDDAENSIYVFMRQGEDPQDMAVIICNFTPVIRHDYRIAVPYAGFYREAINTDSIYYGGSDIGNQGGVYSEAVSYHGRPFSLTLTLPPLATVILVYEERTHV